MSYLRVRFSYDVRNETTKCETAVIDEGLRFVVRVKGESMEKVDENVIQVMEFRPVWFVGKWSSSEIFE